MISRIWSKRVVFKLRVILRSRAYIKKTITDAFSSAAATRFYCRMFWSRARDRCSFFGGGRSVDIFFRMKLVFFVNLDYIQV